MDELQVSRRVMMVGSVTAFALTLPTFARERRRTALPATVQVSWGDQEGNPASRDRIIAAITDAIAASASSGMGASTWVLANA